MKTTRTLLFYLFYSCTLITTFAQGKIIRGIITDSNTGEKLPGVNVIEMNEEERVINGTITDYNGEYIIQIRPGSNALRYSFIGYNSQDVDIGDRTYIEVKLVEASTQLDEIVVVGDRIQTNGFMPVSIRESSASISKIEMQQAEQLGSTSIEEALAGQISGVDISMASGDPGASISVQIRGASSINGKNEPLILINGVVYSTDIEDDFEFTSATADDYGSLVDIAPEDIESIEIYKDAAATALYGPKAANGVLAINTKKGKKGQSLMSYSFKRTWQNAPDPIPLLNGPDYVLMQLDAQYNRAIDLTGAPPTIGGQEFYPILYKQRSEYPYAWEHSQNTDWVDAVTQQGLKSEHNMSISGGGDKATYRLSLGYLDQDGTTKGTGFDRLTTRLNLEYRLSKRLRFNSEFSFTNSHKFDNIEKVSDDEDIKEQTVLELAYKKAPNMSIYEMLGPHEPSDEFFSAYSNFTSWGDTIQNYQGWGDEYYYNPVALIEDGEKITTSNRMLTNLGIDYSIIPERLRIFSNVAYDIQNFDISQFIPQSATGVTYLNDRFNSTYHKDQEKYNIQHTSKLIYTQTFGEFHDLTAVAAYSILSENSISQGGSSDRSPSNQIRNHSSESPIDKLDTDIDSYHEIGYILNLLYKYKDKIHLNPGFRYDGSSRYGLGNKWGFRPVISVAYFLSEEEFMKRFSWINDIKFRASYGQIGKNPENIYETYGLYSSGSRYMNINGVAPKNIQLYNLKWELVEKSNLGVDLYLFDNRLSTTVEYYKDVTSGVLQKEYKIPASTGYEYLKWYNSGIVENNGLEFQTNAKIIKMNNVRFEIDFNFTVNKNKIRKVPANLKVDDVNMLKNGNYTSLIVEGGGVHAYYGYIYDGVYSTDEDAVARDINGNPLIDSKGNPLPMRFNDEAGYIFKAGDAKYRDINHDGLINESDIVQLGNPYPDFHGGFGGRLTLFNDFTVSTSFHFKYGHDIVNETKMNLENMYTKSNQAISVNRRWREYGDKTDIPRALYDYGYNWLGSSRYVEDASFIKLRFISFSYDVPDKFLKKMFIRDFNVFFSMFNLYTWTEYTGQNPEVSVASKDVTYIGKDKSKTPPPKEFSLGFRVKF